MYAESYKWKEYKALTWWSYVCEICPYDISMNVHKMAQSVLSATAFKIAVNSSTFYAPWRVWNYTYSTYIIRVWFNWLWNKIIIETRRVSYWVVSILIHVRFKDYIEDIYKLFLNKVQVYKSYHTYQYTIFNV